MKKLVSIFVLLFFINFTVSPLFWTSSYFGKVTEERTDVEGSESNSSEKESSLELFYSFDSHANQYSCKKAICFDFAWEKSSPVFIEGLIQPPEQFV